MEMLTLSFYDHFIHFCGSGNTAAVPEGYTVMDDTDLDRCFDTLVGGSDVWVRCEQPARRIVEHCHRRYRFVKAAGGLVSTPDGQRLLIHREGQWDLPKGMVEPGETLAQAALREVEEETGIGSLFIRSLLLKTYHIYDKYGGWHLKQTSWFDMTAPCACPTRPQTEEGITEAVWMPLDDAARHLSQSFASLRILCQTLQQP